MDDDGPWAYDEVTGFYRERRVAGRSAMTTNVTAPGTPVWVSDSVRARILEARDGHPDWGVDEIYDKVRWYGGFATHDEIRTVLAEHEHGNK